MERLIAWHRALHQLRDGAACQQGEVGDGLGVRGAGFGEAADDHVAVPDGLDLIDGEERYAIVHDRVQHIQQVDDLAGRHGRGDVGEALNVGEEERHVVEGLEGDGAPRRQVRRDLRGQHLVQQGLLHVNLPSSQLQGGRGQAVGVEFLPLARLESAGRHVAVEAARVAERARFVEARRAVDPHMDDGAILVDHLGRNIPQNFPSRQPAEDFVYDVCVRVEVDDAFADVLVGGVAKCAQLVCVCPQYSSILSNPIRRVFNEVEQLCG
mmetsp:Transcript_121042/g.386592  ORF Transcript_121042/g.386592 Transcript_121042/m.386592 type:complete len:267 (-) Transcript_121042:229-1029(-)